MDDKLFDELLESVKEGAKIMKGEVKPSRIFKNLYEVKDEYFPSVELDQLEDKKKFIWNTRDLNSSLDKNKDNNWNDKPKDIYQNTIIICQHCHKNSGYTEEGFRHFVISQDIKCRNCGKVIIHYDGGVKC